MVTLLDGRIVQDSLLKELSQDVSALKKGGIEPQLTVLMVGAEAASEVYVGHKEKAAEKVGIKFELKKLPESISQEALLKVIEELNNDKSVNGIIVQLPLPKHIEVPKIIKAINPYKDVDGFHAYNLGKMFLDPQFEDLAPCTPKGMIKLLEYYKIDVSGMDAVVIGRSNIVGKPMATMLSNRNATVTLCHSKTKDLKRYTQDADLIVVAVGKAKFLKADMVKEGAIILDVGIHRLDGNKLVGDADTEKLLEKNCRVTPVPGGVGPLTVACLMANTVTAARKQSKL